MRWIIAHFYSKNIPRNCAIGIFFLLMLAGNPLFSQSINPGHSMQDLSILFQEKNYLELFQHLKDIRPSDRNEQWKSMTIKAAAAWVESESNQVVVNNQALDSIIKIAQWKELEESQNFGNLWEEWLLKLFANQLILIKSESNLNPNYERLLSLHDAIMFEWKSNRGNKINFGQTLAKYYTELFEILDLKKAKSEIINSILDPFLTVSDLRLEFLRPTLKSNVSNEYCGQDNIYVWSKLFLTSIAQATLALLKSSKVQDLSLFEVRLAQDMNRGCWEAIREKFMQAFFDGTSKERLELYPLLIQDRSLPPEKMDALFVFYLLDGDQVDPMLAWSYSRLKILAGEFKARERIMNYFYLQSFLPDEFAVKLEGQKISFMLESFNRYFPEYLNHYFKTCLQYLKGGQFPKGNPTAHCQILLPKMQKLSNPSSGKQLLEEIRKLLPKS
jgi:hypothetical protein